MHRRRRLSRTGIRVPSGRGQGFPRGVDPDGDAGDGAPELPRIMTCNGMRSIGGPAMRPCSARGSVAQSGAILHVIALVPEPPPIGGFSGAVPLNRERRLRLADYNPVPM
jgi:hypothetical protein